MTRMEHLNSFFIERLMSVAGEIFEAVKDTVSEYQDEIERTKQENRRLREILTEISLSASSEIRAADVRHSRAGGAPLEQDSNQRPLNSDPSVLQLKLELATIKQEAEPQLPLNDAPTSTSPCAKSAHGEEFKCLSGTPVMVEKNGDDDLHKNKMIAVKLEHCDSQLTRSDTLNSNVEHMVSPSSAQMGNAQVKQGPCVCPYCEEAFVDLPYLTSHLRSHADRLADCKVCGRPFTNCVCLLLHKKDLREKGKSYCCKLCGKCYRHPHSLTIHLRTHTGEKPYCCKFCGKAFIQKGHCNEHERIHTGEKPYTCPICGKGFVQSTPLKSHIRNQHRNQLQVLEGQEIEMVQIRALIKKNGLFSSSQALIAQLGD